MFNVQCSLSVAVVEMKHNDGLMYRAYGDAAMAAMAAMAGDGDLCDWLGELHRKYIRTYNR